MLPDPFFLPNLLSNLWENALDLFYSKKAIAYFIIQKYNHSLLINFHGIDHENHSVEFLTAVCLQIYADERTVVGGNCWPIR